MDEKYIKHLNNQTNAINELSKRINSKVSIEDFEAFTQLILTKIDESTKSIAVLTEGLVDFFTSTLQKDAEANRILVESMQTKIEMKSEINSTKYKGFTIYEEWLTDFMSDFISKIQIYL